MEYREKCAYSVKKDPVTGIETHEVDPTSKSIQYSSEELQVWLNNKTIPKELGEFGLDEMRAMQKDFEDWQEFRKNNPNPSNEQQLEFFKKTKMKTKEEIEKSSTLLKFLLDNHERLELTLNKHNNPDTFAIPSHSLMFSLLAMFAGKPEKIPRKLLEKPHHERTPKEQEEADNYLNSIFESKKEIDYTEGKKTTEDKKIAIICDNSKVESKADISWSLFRKDLFFREERMAFYIKKSFGAEGIRHLLGLIIGLEENFRQGHFDWSVNEHLERLGYRKKNRSFSPELKKTASEIIKIFTGLCITSIRKDGKNDSFSAKFLFMVEGFEVQTFEKEIIDERITLVATDFWYKNAFSPKDKQAPQYTKLLKKIVKENHREHPLTLYLTPLLAIFWRMNPKKKISVKNLMQWCDLDTKEKYKLRDLRNLLSTLEYMKHNGYLGEWSHNGDNSIIEQSSDPFNVCLTLTPPRWLQEEMQLISDQKETFAISDQKENPVSKDELCEILQNLQKKGITGAQFAEHIGVTKQYVSAMKNGKRTITSKIAKKIRLFLDKQSQQK
jgi:hypothetical protein